MSAIASRERFAAMLLTLAACATHGQLDIPVTAPKDDIDNAVTLIKSAPFVLVGQARRASVRGGGVRAIYSSRRVETRREETTVDAVRVLRGASSPKQTVFSCYVWSEQWVPKGAPIELKDEASLMKGPTLFFGRKITEEVVTCAQDLYKSSYPVACGETNSNDGINQQVADLFLGVGSNCDATRLSSKQYLVQAVQIVNQLLGWVAVTDRLSHLVRTGAPEVQTNACIVQSETVLGQDTCLDALASRGNLDNSNRAVVARLVAARDRRDREVSEWLTREPVLWLEGRTTRDHWRQIDLLQLLCRHRNSLIRDLAKKVLQEHYPRRG